MVPTSSLHDRAKEVTHRIGNPLYFLLVIIIVAVYVLFAFIRKITKFRFPKITTRKKTVRLYPPRKISFGIKKTVLYFAFTVLTIALLSGYTFWYFILQDLPDASKLAERQMDISTKIYDRNGDLLYKIYKDTNRTPIQLSNVPRSAIEATLAIEDVNFYLHPGFSIKGIARAIKENLEEGKRTGGSTITQQLVKNTLLTPEKTLIRKLKELVLAIQVEQAYSKDEILEMYLNEVSYGGIAYGIQEASEFYFNKPASELTLAESALLAGLTKSPSTLSPFSEGAERAVARQKKVLSAMINAGFIDYSDANKARAEKINFAPNKIDIKAPHFVMYVKDLLTDKYGKDLVERGGLSVTTSLDLSVQNLVDETIKSNLAKLTSLNVTNAAVIVMSPKTGEILAMAGSKDYFDISSEGNVNVTTRLRQPGSSIKVINYAYALSNGYSPTTIIDDSPKAFKVAGQPPYTPKNYDNKYRGKLTLRSALAESRNVPAVKVLESYGVDKMINLGTQMGITSWTDPSNYGLSLTLGGGDIKLIDIAQVYATIANYGKRPTITSINKIVNYKDKVLFKSCTNCTSYDVLDPRVAYLLIDILDDNRARTPAFGSNSLLVVKGHPEVAVKTGTSNDLRDNWTIGFNQDYLVAVWVGNNDNSPMSRVASGVTGASPIWNEVMTSLIGQRESKPWSVPEGLVRAKYCSYEDWYLVENKPTRPCTIKNVAQSEDSNS